MISYKEVAGHHVEPLGVVRQRRGHRIEPAHVLHVARLEPRERRRRRRVLVGVQPERQPQEALAHDVARRVGGEAEAAVRAELVLNHVRYELLERAR